jgi:Thioredoxin-like proteins and domains
MTLTESIKDIIDNTINPLLSEHGRSIALIDVQDKRVKVRFLGNCATCPSVHETLELIVEKHLKAQLGDQINEVSISYETSQELIDFAKNYLSRKKI